MEQMITDLGLNEKQAKDFKAAMKEMRPAKSNSGERPSREEMQKKRTEGEAKIKSILTDEQYKKYQDMRKKENADRKKKAK
jgi:protein CpxP